MTGQRDDTAARGGVSSPRGWPERTFLAAAVVVGLGIVLSISGRWVGWPWLRFAPYATFIGVAILLAAGLVPIQRAILSTFREWFRGAYARNERRAQSQVADSQDEVGPPMG